LNADASIWLTRPKAGISFGVMFVHVFPPSRVTCTRPSSDPVQIVLTLFLPGPMEKIVPYTSGPFMSPVIGPPDLSCVSGAWRVRSPLTAVQVRPPSLVRQRRCEETYSVFGSTGEKMIGYVHCHRSLISFDGSPE
jgi:hypothetical protein